jgi:hypothetical protein
MRMSVGRRGGFRVSTRHVGIGSRGGVRVSAGGLSATNRGNISYSASFGRRSSAGSAVGAFPIALKGLVIVTLFLLVVAYLMGLATFKVFGIETSDTFSVSSAEAAELETDFRIFGKVNYPAGYSGVPSGDYVDLRRLDAPGWNGSVLFEAVRSKPDGGTMMWAGFGEILALAVGIWGLVSWRRTKPAEAAAKPGSRQPGA